MLFILYTSPVLLSAALHDIRTRRVPDFHWVLLCAAGVPATASSLTAGAGICPAVLYASGAALLAAYMLSERLSGLRAIPVVASAVLLLVLSAVRGAPVEVAFVPLVFFLMLALHRAGFLAGGADAKCLMSVALSLPFFPADPLVWGPVLCPAFAVLAYALVLSIPRPVATLVRNVRARDFGKGIASSYSIPAEEFDELRHWPAGGGADGTVRVIPTIPFVAPMAAGFLLALLLGSPFAFRCPCPCRTTSTWTRPGSRTR